MEDENLRTGQKRGIKFKAGVFGRCAHKRYGPVLDIRQEAILLRAVEPMDFVHEKKRLLPKAGMIAGCGKHRSEEHTYELQSLMRITYDVFCLKKKIKHQTLDDRNRPSMTYIL